MTAQLQIDGIRREFAAVISVGQAGCRVFPDQQHGALGRKALVPDIGRHRGHIAWVHDDSGPRPACFLVADLPGDLVTELDKPLNPVVAVNNGQHMFLGCRAEQAVATHRGNGRIPRHVGARQIFKQVNGVDLVLKAGLGLNLRLVLVDIGKRPIDGIAVVV